MANFELRNFNRLKTKVENKNGLLVSGFNLFDHLSKPLIAAV